jgi:hypothetical protein
MYVFVGEGERKRVGPGSRETGIAKIIGYGVLLLLLWIEPQIPAKQLLCNLHLLFSVSALVVLFLTGRT